MVSSRTALHDAPTIKLSAEVGHLLNEVKAKIETAALYDPTGARQLSDVVTRVALEIAKFVDEHPIDQAEFSAPTDQASALDLLRRLTNGFTPEEAVARSTHQRSGSGVNAQRAKSLGPMPLRIVEFLEASETPLRPDEIALLLREGEWPEVTEGNVGVTLHRMVADGVLKRPRRGHYAVAEDYLRRRDTASARG